jgi:AraC-like DNA-binding protein
VAASTRPGRFQRDLVFAAADHFAARICSRAFKTIEAESVTGSQWLNYAKDVLDANLESNMPLHEMLSEIPLSYEHLSRSFRAAFGRSLRAYRMEARADLARELLAGNEGRITDIAYRLGYSSSQHFATEFKRQTGSTPSAYRSRGR